MEKNIIQFLKIPGAGASVNVGRGYGCGPLPEITPFHMRVTWDSIIEKLKNRLQLFRIE